MVMCPKQQQNANWSQVEIEILIVKGRNLPRTSSTKYETQNIFAKKKQNEHTPEDKLHKIWNSKYFCKKTAKRAHPWNFEQLKFKYNSSRFNF